MSWKQYEFRELAVLSSDKYYPTKSDEEHPCIELEHIDQVTGRLLGTISSREQKSTKNVFKKNQVLYGKLRPYLRKYYMAEFDGVCSTEIWVFNGKKDIIINDYLFYLVQTDQFNKSANVSSGSKMPRADWDYVGETVFKIPSIFEQKKISRILAKWDKAIELKERLIEEKKNQKTGLMQKLLTGKVRLSGFDEKWKEVKLGSVMKERNETNYDENELLAITSKNGVVRRSEIDIKDNSSDDKSRYKRICPMDIGYNTMRMWQGVSGVSEYEGIVSPAYTILKPTEKVNSYFMGYLFKLPEIVNLFWRYSQGLTNDTLNLKYTNLKNIKVTMPLDLNEQKKIVEILQTMDKNIEIMGKELESLKEQKKGLMQLLLTGIVQVNPQEN